MSKEIEKHLNDIKKDVQAIKDSHKADKDNNKRFEELARDPEFLKDPDQTSLTIGDDGKPLKIDDVLMKATENL